MNCSNCKTRNPIGSNFCRNCGGSLTAPTGSLAEEEARRVEEERTREQVAELLTRAFGLSERNQVADAIPLAEEASRLLPTSTAAHALCATLYERARRNEDAIAAMEKVVELNPDSAVDRDKLERMRRGVHWAPRREPAPEEKERPRWLPFAAAAGVFALVCVLGVVVLRGSASSRTRTPRSLVKVDAPPATVFVPAATPAPNLLSPTPMPGWTSPTPAPAVVDNGRSDPFAPIGSRPMGQAVAPTPGPQLPNFTGGGSVDARGTLPPLGGVQNAQSVPPVTVARPPQSDGAGNGIPAGPPPNNPTPAPSGDSGYIRIQVNPPKTGDKPADPSDPLVRAQMHQSGGRYREALAAYRSALDQGADAGECQQGIALCHQRLGEDDAAREAYRRAIVAYEAQISGARRRFAEKGLSACRAALEVLGG